MSSRKFSFKPDSKNSKKLSFNEDLAQDLVETSSNSTDKSVLWTLKIEEKLLQLMKKEWDESKNVNSFLYLKFCEQHPVFLSENLQKGIKNKEGYVLSKSLYCRFVNKIMSRRSTNTGKKELANRIVRNALQQAAETWKLSVPHLLLLLLVKVVPNFGVRSLRFGSGTITRAVKLTILKKISWFLREFANLFKTRKVKFQTLFLTEIAHILSNNPKSKLLTLKRESLVQAQKANIQ